MFYYRRSSTCSSRAGTLVKEALVIIYGNYCDHLSITRSVITYVTIWGLLVDYFGDYLVTT